MPQQNVAEQDQNVDLTEEALRPGDRLLLCSDGLTSMVEDDEILSTLHEAGDDPAASCRALVNAANSRGGDDNITAILVQIRD